MILLISANIFKTIFVINLIALITGVVLARSGYIKTARVLSYISFAGIFICIIYMIVIMTPFFTL